MNGKSWLRNENRRRILRRTLAASTATENPRSTHPKELRAVEQRAPQREDAVSPAQHSDTLSESVVTPDIASSAARCPQRDEITTFFPLIERLASRLLSTSHAHSGGAATSLRSDLISVGRVALCEAFRNNQHRSDSEFHKSVILRARGEMVQFLISPEHRFSRFILSSKRDSKRWLGSGVERELHTPAVRFQQLKRAAESLTGKRYPAMGKHFALRPSILDLTTEAKQKDTQKRSSHLQLVKE